MSMKRALLVIGLALGFVGGALLPSSQALAETITWKVKSNYKYRVQIEFYSQTRNHVWPGNDKAWGLNDYAVHTFALSCISGEKICFGAWPTGKSSPYWGVGPDNKYSCKSCCAICGEGDPVTQILNP